MKRCPPSDELLSSEISRRSYRERLAGGDMGRVREDESGDVGGRPLPDCDPKRTSRGIHCGDVCYCQLALNRSYAEPVMPLGRQRDSAAAVRRGPCSRE